MTTCQLPDRPSFAKATEDKRRLENRGMLWMVGAFVFCPCHLPLTLGAFALVFGGTAAGALLHAHPYIAAIVVTALWIAGTWRGLVLVGRASAFAARPVPSAAPASACHPDHQ
jgi:mercuric ion transport protein